MQVTALPPLQRIASSLVLSRLLTDCELDIVASEVVEGGYIAKAKKAKKDIAEPLWMQKL